MLNVIGEKTSSHRIYCSSVVESCPLSVMMWVSLVSFSLLLLTLSRSVQQLLLSPLTPSPALPNLPTSTWPRTMLLRARLTWTTTLASFK